MTDHTTANLNQCCICKKHFLHGEHLPALFLGRICKSCDSRIKRTKFRDTNVDIVTTKKGTIKKNLVSIIGKNLALAFATSQPHHEVTEYGTTVTYTPPT
jgi:hypothetical protein